MEFQEVVHILRSEGYKKSIKYKENEIIEEPRHQDDDYYSLIKSNFSWEFCHVHNERKQSPDYEILGTFDSKDKAGVIFFLNRLHTFYLFEYISMSEQKTGLLQKGEYLVIEDLFGALEQYRIPLSFLSLDTVQPHSMRIFEENEGWRTEYIDAFGQAHCKSRCDTLSFSISVAFSRILYLYLLDTMTQKYLNDSAINYFGVDEIVYYLRGK